MKSFVIFSCFAAFILLQSCARSALKTTDQAMRPAATTPVISDDLDFVGIDKALLDTISVLVSRNPNLKLHFGKKTISAIEYAKHLQKLVNALQKDSNGQAFRQMIHRDFEFLEVYGQDDWGQIFMTSYYEPVIQGSMAPNAIHSQALYSSPQDMIYVDLEAYAQINSEIKRWIQKPIEQKSSQPQLRGRLVAESGQVVPYFSREEIDSDRALLGRNLELAWVDPIDAFFLQIQGSGMITFEDGQKLHLGYAGQNGHPYYAIGKSLYHAIEREQMSMKAIDSYLRTLSPRQMQNILNENPSYVFFKPLKKGGAVTYMGTEVTAGRTIATDYRIFPKGGLAFLQFEKPEFEGDSPKPSNWSKVSRFVVDQDTGGAIRGPHRLDLYWGRGKQAARAAGVMKNPGRLYYLFPKEK